MSESIYILGDVVYLRYQSVGGTNRGTLVGTAQIDEDGSCEYAIEMPCGRRVIVRKDAMSLVPIVHPTMEAVLRILNEALVADPAAITALMRHRVPANTALEDHPSVLVDGMFDRPDIGALGLINGFMQPLTGKRIALVCKETGGPLTAFVEYVPTPLTASKIQST